VALETKEVQSADVTPRHAADFAIVHAFTPRHIRRRRAESAAAAADAAPLRHAVFSRLRRCRRATLPPCCMLRQRAARRVSLSAARRGSGEQMLTQQHIERLMPMTIFVDFSPMPFFVFIDTLPRWFSPFSRHVSSSGYAF